MRSWFSGLGKTVAPVVISGVLVAACQTVQTTQGGAVGVDRKQSMMVSAADVDKAAAANYQQVLGESKKKGALNADVAQTERVRGIARRLIPQVAVFREDALKWNWEVNVIESDELNAWCMPGGKIAFYSGIIEKLKLTDDEIAAIMGHEMAHALREHARERASKAMAAGIGVQVVGAVAGLGDIGTQLTSVLADITFVKPNSRLHETESDRIGIELAARAGYDPRAAVGLWKKMSENGGGQPPQWLSTHPSHETRIKDIEKYAARVMPLYEKARGKS
ncbi:MAG TPA: M48 family metallopeptidase [Rhodocyclaceae bacterium]|nr:M48 family metallopeptidase [Rhodocyclaceae bacterium]HMV54530.1 M48 family metallopeptidase [Rhodocyclaceae bacterium]HMZ83877.1 M48 family metallopeptidase [Rhodocyclaceae bacterium]HNA02326.1 M48 family metallopeptidase [Rhodocyclaceae bacterium]HNB78256.1 M48 family metallopeptidase [Rhodocyclaceae bacterium]